MNENKLRGENLFKGKRGVSLSLSLSMDNSMFSRLVGLMLKSLKINGDEYTVLGIKYSKKSLPLTLVEKSLHNKSYKTQMVTVSIAF